MTESQMQELFEKARIASQHSYSPYSKYAVGAAVLTRGGATYVGTNVENASYGLTICAERVAICSAVAAGKKDIIAVAVYAKSGGVTPCGACRQFIAEFGDSVDVVHSRGTRLICEPIRDLLPGFFSRRELGI